MPKLVFPVLVDGLLVDILIGIDGAKTAAPAYPGAADQRTDFGSKRGDGYPTRHVAKLLRASRNALHPT
jgi:hypothetical protein